MGNGNELGRLTGEPLSRREITVRTRRVINDYARESIKALYPTVRRGEGKVIIGSVPGRPEDDQLGIDSYGEDLLANLIRDIQLPAIVLGEHNPPTFTEFGQPQVIIPIDAFDNSSEYMRGLDTPVYTVVSAYSLDGKPIAGAVCNIRDRKAFIAHDGGVYELDTEMPDHYSQVFASRRTTLKDDKATIASYLGSKEYSLKFFKHFGKMIEDMPPKARLYAGGGAFIYGLLANGSVDAYVMFDEPYSEIFPGFTLARSAKCTVVSVNPDGSYEEIKLTPEFYENPQLYVEGKVPFFIAAATPEIRDEIIDYYMKARKD
ncbi:MAG: hypothetical protein HYT08_03490 [Candidatus Levybacteria bacterium]|nr:hypothetical protein [Candidatus Levybacteria bacterium]